MKFRCQHILVLRHLRPLVIQVLIKTQNVYCSQHKELSQDMIKGPNLLTVGPGRGLVSSHNLFLWNLAIFFYILAENRQSKRRLDGSLAKSLVNIRVTVLRFLLMYPEKFSHYHKILKDIIGIKKLPSILNYRLLNIF